MFLVCFFEIGVMGMDGMGKAHEWVGLSGRTASLIE